MEADLSIRNIKTDLDFLQNKDILAPVVFRSYFNKFEKLDASQAWSLAFSGGQEDKILNLEPELGRFFNHLLIGFTVAAIFSVLLFNS